MYHLFHNSMWKVVRIAKTSDCKISWRVFLQGTVQTNSYAFVLFESRTKITAKSAIKVLLACRSTTPISFRAAHSYINEKLIDNIVFFFKLHVTLESSDA